MCISLVVFFFFFYQLFAQTLQFIFVDVLCVWYIILGIQLSFSAGITTTLSNKMKFAFRTITTGDYLWNTKQEALPHLQNWLRQEQKE